MATVQVSDLVVFFYNEILIFIIFKLTIIIFRIIYLPKIA